MASVCMSSDMSAFLITALRSDMFAAVQWKEGSVGVARLKRGTLQASTLVSLVARYTRDYL